MSAVGTAANPPRVWIDLDNSPHVLFFAPLIEKLRSNGVEAIVTVRSFAQTEELARFHGLQFVTVGKHRTHSTFVMRGLATLHRALQLAKIVCKAHPDASVSHGSRALVIACWLLRIPAMTFYDYEFAATQIYNRLSRKALAPSTVPVSRL